MQNRCDACIVNREWILIWQRVMSGAVCHLVRGIQPTAQGALQWVSGLFDQSMGRSDWTAASQTGRTWWLGNRSFVCAGTATIDQLLNRSHHKGVE